MLQIVQEVLLETPGPSTAHCIASEPAVVESEIEVQAGHEQFRLSQLMKMLVYSVKCFVDEQKPLLMLVLNVTFGDQKYPPVL